MSDHTIYSCRPHTIGIRSLTLKITEKIWYLLIIKLLFNIGVWVAEGVYFFWNSKIVYYGEKWKFLYCLLIIPFQFMINIYVSKLHVMLGIPGRIWRNGCFIPDFWKWDCYKHGTCCHTYSEVSTIMKIALTVTLNQRGKNTWLFLKRGIYCHLSLVVNTFYSFMKWHLLSHLFRGKYNH